MATTVVSDDFTPERFGTLTDVARGAVLQDLSSRCTDLVCRAHSLKQHQDVLYAVVARLKGLNHDIWRRDYDSEDELWGGDYTDPSNAGQLTIRSHFPGCITFQWHVWRS